METHTHTHTLTSGGWKERMKENKKLYAGRIEK
jgi:hypothetical protein